MTLQGPWKGARSSLDTFNQIMKTEINCPICGATNDERSSYMFGIQYEGLEQDEWRTDMGLGETITRFKCWNCKHDFWVERSGHKVKTSPVEGESNIRQITKTENGQPDNNN